MTTLEAFKIMLESAEAKVKFNENTLATWRKRLRDYGAIEEHSMTAALNVTEEWKGTAAEWIREPSKYIMIIEGFGFKGEINGNTPEECMQKKIKHFPKHRTTYQNF